MIRFVEVVNATDFNPRMERTAHLLFTLEEVWINEAYVVNVREAASYRKLLQEGRLPSDLRADHEFSCVTVNNGPLTERHIVVGSLEEVMGRLHRDKRTLLKG
jgi:hypothetical protein